MVNLSTGLALTSTTRTGSTAGTTGVSVTITPEQAKLNHIADILSSCVNNATSGSSACSSLYNYAVPVSDLSTTSVPNATAGRATDVLQAAYCIFSNPTNRTPANLAGLYNIPAAAGSPYMPRLTTQPTDWTIGINYTSAGVCSDTSTSPANFLTNPRNISIDLSGNLWFANNQAGSAASRSSPPRVHPSPALPSRPAPGPRSLAQEHSPPSSTPPGNIWGRQRPLHRRLSLHPRHLPHGHHRLNRQPGALAHG